MSDINFPSSPSLNDTYTYNDITYTWDGEKWTAYSTLIAGSANYSDNQVDIHLNQSNPTDGYVLSWTGGDYAWVAQSGGGSGIALTDLSVTTATPSGNGSLSYNNVSGVFTFTPADTSSSGGSSYGNSDVEAYLSGGDGIDFASGVIDVDSTVVRTTGTQSIAGAKTFVTSSSDDFIISNTTGGNGKDFFYKRTYDDSYSPEFIFEKSRGSQTNNGDQLGSIRWTSHGGTDIGAIAVAYNSTGPSGSMNFRVRKSDGSFSGSANSIVLNNDQSVTISDAYTLPTSDGSANQVLQTDGSGTLSFATVSGGGSSYGDANVATFLSTNNYSNTDIQPATITADSTDGTALALEGGDATGLNSTGGNVDINAGTGVLQNGVVNIGQSSQGVYIGANSSTAIDVTGPLTVNNQLIIEDGVSEKFSSLTGATGVVTHDCDNGHIFYHSSISADFTANFTNLGLSTNYGTTLTLILDQGATARIPSAVQISGSAQTINWQGGSAPTGTNNGVDAVSFTILRVSGNYVVLGQLVDFT